MVTGGGQAEGVVASIRKVQDQNTSMKELFADLSGSLLLEAVWETYGDGADKQIVIMWFNSAGERNIIRSIWNRYFD